MHVPNIGRTKYIKQILTDWKGALDNTIIVGHFNISISIDIHSRQKVNMELLDFTYTLDQMNLTGMYRTFYSTAVEYAFSRTQKTFPKMDPLFCHKS